MSGGYGSAARRPVCALASIGIALAAMLAPATAANAAVTPAAGPAAVFAAGPVTGADDAAGAEDAAGGALVAPIDTRVTVAFPLIADHTIYTLSASASVSATVVALPADGQVATAALTGTVEFFDGAQSLGAVPVAADGGSADVTATLEHPAWAAAGLRHVTATFTPAGAAYAAATSASQSYRVVDTSRVIPDIALDIAPGGQPAATVSDASLEWTIANIWFSNFNVGFEREALSGNVTLPEVARGSTIPELQAYYFRPFTFSAGSGQVDAAGSRLISFTGVARLTSGSGNEWNFADPQVHIAPNGDGYVTAEFSGFYRIGGDQTYAPTRVTIATFRGATFERDAAGVTSARIELGWAGQAQGAGTWAHEHNDSFPNEFIALLNPGINLFFAQSSVATDNSKIPHPITLSFRETAVPAGPGEPGGSETPGGSESPGGQVGPGGSNPGNVTPVTSHPDTSAAASASADRLPATGAEAPLAAAAGALALLALGAGLLRRARGSKTRG